MKKLIFCAFLVPLISGVYAQQEGETTWGVRAGINLQNIYGRDNNGDKLNNKLKTGFNLGVNAEIPIAPQFYFQPGLAFITRGARDKDSTQSQTVAINLDYIDLPLNFIYKAARGNGKVLIGFGPYLGYGVGGKIKSGSQSTNVKFNGNPAIDSTSSDFFVKPFEAGFNILFGWEFSNNFSAQLNAQLGLGNLNAYGGKAKTHNTGFGVSLGYRFARSRRDAAR